MLVGAQDVSRFGPGAHTGETTAEVLAELGCRLVMIGHPERARDQHETGLQRIGQGFNRRLVLGALFFQSGQRAETRGVALARFQKARPGARQLQDRKSVV